MKVPQQGQHVDTSVPDRLEDREDGAWVGGRCPQTTRAAGGSPFSCTWLDEYFIIKVFGSTMSLVFCMFYLIRFSEQSYRYYYSVLNCKPHDMWSLSLYEEHIIGVNTKSHNWQKLKVDAHAFFKFSHVVSYTTHKLICE